MKLAIGGPHGVGKTTLAQSIEKELRWEYNLPIIPELARKVASEMGYNSTQEILKAGLHIVKLYQRKVWFAQVQRERELVSFLSDRSLFDIVTYMELYGLCHDMVEEYTGYSVRLAKQYDLIIYTPIPVGATLVNDGFRLIDPEEQKAYDIILRRMLQKAECKVIYLPDDRAVWHPLAVNEIREVAAHE